MTMSEAQKVPVNLLSEINHGDKTFSWICTCLRDNTFSKWSCNEAWKCMWAKVLDKNEILKCFNVIFFISK